MAESALGLDARALEALRANLWPAGAGSLKGRLILIFAMTLVSSSLAATGPLFMRRLVDALSLRPLMAIPIVLTFAYPLTRLTGLWLIQARVILTATVMESAKARYGAAALAGLLRLGRELRVAEGAAALARQLERGVVGLETSIRSTHVVLFQVLLEAVFSCVVLSRVIGLGFGAIMMAVMLGYAMVAIGFTRRQVRLRREINAYDTAANRRLVDALANHDVVHAFGAAAHEAERYGAARAEQARFAVRAQAAISGMNMGWQALEALALGGVLTLAAHDVLAGRMSVGALVMAQVYMMQVFANMAGLGVVYSDARQGFVDLGQLQAALEREPAVAEAPRAPPLRADRGEVVFDRVSFGYEPGRLVLSEVSFTVPAGATVALVGASGGGKTTLGRLLQRFYDPLAGEVRIDGQDIRGVTLASLRAAIGVVPQDTLLFDDTLAFNIRYGRLAASDAEVAAAARRAALGEVVARLPAGFDTRIGERGVRLSGGERQRIALARLVLKAPRIFLFDEATSSLDNVTERAVQQSLREVSAGRTRIVIAHRLSTIVDADQILVLDEGRIVERGDHGSLLREGRAYAALWERQAIGAPVSGAAR